MKTAPPLPEDVEAHRDAAWQRDPARCVATVLDAERFIERAGFAACLTDAVVPARRSTSRCAGGATR